MQVTFNPSGVLRLFTIDAAAKRSREMSVLIEIARTTPAFERHESAINNDIFNHFRHLLRR